MTSVTSSFRVGEGCSAVRVGGVEVPGVAGVKGASQKLITWDGLAKSSRCVAPLLVVVTCGNLVYVISNPSSLAKHGSD